jgi:hypothetical protein
MADRDWLYRLSGGTLIVLTPKQHRNKMIEIIDFGYCSLGSASDQHIAADMRQLLSRYQWLPEHKQGKQRSLGSHLLEEKLLFEEEAVPLDPSPFRDDNEERWFAAPLFDCLRRFTKDDLESPGPMPLLIGACPSADSITLKRPRSESADTDEEGFPSPKRQRLSTPPSPLQQDV